MARYADAPEVSVALRSSASAAQLWTLITDINLPAQFSDEFDGGSWLDEGAPFLGARFTGRNVRPSASWSVTCTVVDFEPERVFGWVVEDPEHPVATWRFSITPDGAGATLTYWAKLGPARSGLTPMIEANPEREERIVDMRMDMWRANMEATLAGIVALAEAS